MIIPRAIFLKQTWLKSQADLKGQARNERTLVTGRLAVTLRNPQSHRAGKVSVFFARDSYPVLTSGTCPDLMVSVVSAFEEAGYRVSVSVREDGVDITLDWRAPEEG